MTNPQTTMHKIIGTERNAPKVYIHTCQCGKRWYSTSKNNAECPSSLQEKLESSY